MINLNAEGIESEETFGRLFLSEIIDQPGTSVFVPTQLPQFVREDHPKFINFLESYYRWLEENDNVGEKIRKIKEQQDIDLAKPEFAEQFYREFLVNVPRTVLVNKKILLKYIRQFYRAKGTEKSYRLFFRMLFDTSVDFYYPATDILKVSDGKWIQPRCLRIFPISGTMNDYSDTKIVGKQNGVVAYVDQVRRLRIGPYMGYELILNTSSITGRFMPNELITTEDEKFSAIISPIPTTYSFTFDINASKYNTGNGYKIGDVFDIKNATGRGGRIKVTSIVPTQRILTDVVITEERSDNVEQIYLGNKNISVITNVICANDGGNYIALPQKTVGQDPNSGVVFENVKSRYELREDSDGRVFLSLNPYYKKPEGRVLVEYEYLIEEESGSVDKLQIINFGLGYSSFEDQSERSFIIQLNSSACVTKGFTGSGAEVKIVVGALGVYPGFYANEDGHLSASKVIPDNYYYQQYAYETITNHSTEEYRQALKNLVHPIGFKFFGKFRQQNLLNMRASISSQVRREFKQFHRPNVLSKSPPIPAQASARTQIAVVSQTSRRRVAQGFGPSNYSIFRERFNYKPMERINASLEVDGVNANYWGDRSLLATQFANTSIQKFMSMVPVALEGVTDDIKASLARVSETLKSGLPAVRGDMIFNSTKNIVELYDGVKWIEVAPNKRINMLPDSFVSTTTTED